MEDGTRDRKIILVRRSKFKNCLSSKLFHFLTESCREMIFNFKASKFTEELRLKSMKDWNIIDENGKPTPAVVNAASKLHSLTEHMWRCFALCVID
jgi:exonuclease I